MTRYLLILVVLCTACERAAVPDPQVEPDLETEPTFLALGDSYTICEGLAPEDRWPNVLAERRGWSPPKIVARTGWTVAELDQAIDDSVPDDAVYDNVSLLIGVNDEFRGGDVDDYRPAFSAMLDRAIGFADGQPERVFVVSIPDYGVTPFGQMRDSAAIAQRLDAYNAVASEVSSDRNVTFVDITPYSREHPAQVTSDGLHPSAEQYAAWVDRIIAARP